MDAAAVDAPADSGERMGRRMAGRPTVESEQVWAGLLRSSHLARIGAGPARNNWTYRPVPGFLLRYQ